MSTNPPFPEMTQTVGASTDPLPETLPSPQTSSDQPDPYLGMTLQNRYLIEKSLGKGGIGTVYLVRDLTILGRPVAIKVLQDRAYEQAWTKKKFLQEIEALVRIDHPAVIGVLDVGKMPDGKPYFVMPFVEGVTLRSILKPGGLEFKRIAHLMRQICQALSAAHDRNIYHRDLKPENIMIQSVSETEEQIKLIDFGVAKVLDSQVGDYTTHPQVIGTLRYMSPEQLMMKEIPLFSDIYALGIIAYEMVTGQHPFNPASIFQLLELQRSGVEVKPTALRPDLPEAAQKAIFKALAFDPNQRYSRARDFGEALTQALIEPVASTSQENILAPDHTPKRIHRHAFWIGAMAGLLLLSLASYAIWHKGKSHKTSMPVEYSAPLPTPTLTYWLTVQKVRDDKPYQEPFVDSGRHVFESGYLFRLNFVSALPGHLYLFNEGPNDDQTIGINILFPLPQGDPNIMTLLTIPEKSWFRFDQNPGVEKFWIVWSKKPINELESLKKLINPTDRGIIRDPNPFHMLQNLFAQKAFQGSQRETNDERIEVIGEGDMIVTSINLKHR